MTDGRIVMMVEMGGEKAETEEDPEESLEDLEKTILSLCSGIQQRARKLETSESTMSQRETENFEYQNNDLLCALSPIKRQQQEIAVVTPLNHTWIGQTQSTPNTDMPHCPPYSRRGLMYPSGPDLEFSIQEEDTFPVDVYDDGMTYEDLLSEVSRISQGSLPTICEKAKTHLSKIHIEEIISASENQVIPKSPQQSHIDDIHDERYFAQPSATSSLSVAGRFTGIQKSRHVFDESSVSQDPAPSADILGLEKFVCSDMDIDEDDEDEEEMEDELDRTKTFRNMLVQDRQSITEATVKSTCTGQKKVEEICFTSSASSLSNSNRQSKPLKEPGELSSTLTAKESEYDLSPMKKLIDKVTMRKRKLSKLRGSEKEEGELSTTVDTEVDDKHLPDSEDVESGEEQEMTFIEKTLIEQQPTGKGYSTSLVHPSVEMSTTLKWVCGSTDDSVVDKPLDCQSKSQPDVDFAALGEPNDEASHHPSDADSEGSVGDVEHRSSKLATGGSLPKSQQLDADSVFHSDAVTDDPYDPTCPEKDVRPRTSEVEFGGSQQPDADPDVPGDAAPESPYEDVGPRTSQSATCNSHSRFQQSAADSDVPGNVATDAPDDSPSKCTDEDVRPGTSKIESGGSPPKSQQSGADSDAPDDATPKCPNKDVIPKSPQLPSGSSSFRSWKSDADSDVPSDEAFDDHGEDAQPKSLHSEAAGTMSSSEKCASKDSVCPSHINYNDFVLSLTEDEDDVNRVLFGSSEKQSLKSPSKGKASASAQNSFIADGCQEMILTKSPPITESFVIIDSPIKSTEESFLIIAHPVEEQNHVESISFVKNDSIDLGKEFKVVNISENPTFEPDAKSELFVESGTLVPAYNKESFGNEISPVRVLKRQRDNVKVEKQTSVHPGGKHFLEGEHDRHFSKSPVERPHVKVISPVLAPNTKRESPSSVCPIAKKTLGTENETHLMKTIRQKWSSKGIQRPDENLSFSSWLRKEDKKTKIKPMFYLEGNRRTPPLFRDNTTVNKDTMDTASEYESPKLKKRRISKSPHRGRSNTIMSELQQQILDIESEQDHVARMLSKQHEMKIRHIKKLHAQHYQSLRTQQNLEKNQYYHLQSGYVVPAYLEYQQLLLHHEHVFQEQQLETMNKIEMNKLLDILDEEKRVQTQRFEILKEPKKQMLNTFTHQSRASRAQMETAAPHATVELWKGPCKSNHRQKSLVQVCLPTDIAGFMVREDEIYDAYYTY